MIKIGILGGAGYTAGELIRLLVNHPSAQIQFINSESNAGNLITDVHEGLYGECDLRFTSDMPFDQVDVLCLFARIDHDDQHSRYDHQKSRSGQYPVLCP